MLRDDPGDSGPAAGMGGRHLRVVGDSDESEPHDGAPIRTDRRFEASKLRADETVNALLRMIRARLLDAVMEGETLERAVDVLRQQVVWQGQDIRELLEERGLLRTGGASE